MPAFNRPPTIPSDVHREEAGLEFLLASNPLAQLSPADPTGVGDSSAAFKTALAAGGYVYVPKGNYKISAAVPLAAQTVIMMGGATITTGSANGVFTLATTDVSVQGQYTVAGAALASDIWALTNGAARFVHEANVNFANIPVGSYLIRATQASGVTLKGQATSTDSELIFTDRASDVDVSGFRLGPYTRDISSGNGVIEITNTTGSTSWGNINVHDGKIDGGGQVQSYALVVITAGTAAGPAPVGVRCSNLHLTNTAVGADGLDIIICNEVAVTNCTFDSVNNGFNCAGCTWVLASNCLAQTCRGAGFQAGDPTVPAGTNLVNFTTCIAYNCGGSNAGGSSPVATGIQVFAHSGQNVNLVFITACQANSSGNVNVLYGFAVSGPGTNATIQGLGGYVLGTTAGILDASNVGNWFNIWNYNPVSLGATVTAGSNPWTYTANTSPETLYLIGGTISNVTINGVSIATTALATDPIVVTLDPKAAMVVTYSGAPTVRRQIH